MPRDYHANHPQHEPVETQTHPHTPCCPGKCNAAWRAAETRRETNGTDHDLEPWPGKPVWCPPCVTSIRGALEDWPALASALQNEIDSGIAETRTGYISGSRNHPVHQHEAESLLLDEFAEWIGSWEDSIRTQRALAPRKNTDLHHDPRRIITEAARVLPAHLDWHLSARPEGEWWIAEEFGTDLLNYHRKAQILTATREAQPERCRGVPCPICDYKALAWELEDGPSPRKALDHYVYGSDGQPATVHRPLGPGRTGKITERQAVLLHGSATGGVYCRRCKPTFRLTAAEYHKWTRIVVATDARVRGKVTAQFLAEVFGGAVPAQYAKLAA